MGASGVLSTFKTIIMPAARPPIQALLIDLSGTLHVGSTPIPGAVEALSRLRQYNAHGDPTHADLGNPLIRTDPVCSADAQDVSLLARQKLPFRFCSNTSKEGRQELQQRLSGMGFEIRVEDDELWTSLGALSGLLRRKGLKNPFCFLQESAKQEVLSNLGCSGGARSLSLSLSFTIMPHTCSHTRRRGESELRFRGCRPRSEHVHIRAFEHRVPNPPAL